MHSGKVLRSLCSDPLLKLGRAQIPVTLAEGRGHESFHHPCSHESHGPSKRLHVSSTSRDPAALTPLKNRAPRYSHYLINTSPRAVAWKLSLVNKELRDFALPVIWTTQSVDEQKAFFLIENPSLSSLVRSAEETLIIATRGSLL